MKDLYIMSAAEAVALEPVAQSFVTATRSTFEAKGAQGELRELVVANGLLALMRACSVEWPDTLEQGEVETALGAAIGVLMATHSCPSCAISQVFSAAVEAAEQMTGGELPGHPEIEGEVH